MSNEPEFVNGLIVKAPHANAPDFVKASLSIRRAELIEWLQGRDGEWVNLDVKESRGGKWYASVNDLKPKEGGAKPASRSAPQRQAPQSAPDFDDDENLPF